MGTSHTDNLVSPDSGLSHEADGWLRHGVLEVTPLTAVTPDPVVPTVRRDRRKRTTQRTAKPAVNPAAQYEHIRLLAYQLFEQRGYEHGHDVEDWVRAEEIVLARSGAALA